MAGCFYALIALASIVGFQARAGEPRSFEPETTVQAFSLATVAARDLARCIPAEVCDLEEQETDERRGTKAAQPLGCASASQCGASCAGVSGILPGATAPKALRVAISTGGPRAPPSRG